MTVAITNDLRNIGPALRRAGHNTVPYGAYIGAIDAVVYRGNLLHTGMAMTNYADGCGILMINAENKSVNEILNCLKNKTYSPLF